MTNDSTITVAGHNSLQTRVWIGCLSCYSAGHLVGNWYAATDASAVTPLQLHERNGRRYSVDHEELWVLDHENLPIAGECSPLVASAWANLIDELEDWESAPFGAWARGAGTYWCDGDGLPSISDFRDAYAGSWESFIEYAAELLDQTGDLESIPEPLRNYFDVERYARDLAYDYDVIPAPGDGVWVFLCN